MSEEVNLPSKEELLNLEPEPAEAPPEQTPQLSEVEQRAMQLGWTPKEQWGGDPTAWRDAATWLDRGEMLRTIQQLKDKQSVTERQVAEAFKKGVQMTEARLKEEISTLRALKREAMERGEFDKVEHIDDKIDDLKDKVKEAAKAPPTPEVQTPPEFSVFVQRNPWYESNKKLRYMADAVGREFLEMKGGPNNTTPAELYFYVEQEMQQYVPAKKSPPAPTGGNQTAGRNPAAGVGGSTASIEAQMSDEERGIMNTLVKTGVFSSKAEYLKEYAKTR